MKKFELHVLKNQVWSQIENDSLFVQHNSFRQKTLNSHTYKEWTQVHDTEKKFHFQQNKKNITANS